MNNHIDEKSLFRLAAIVYSNSTGDIYTANTLLSMIEGVLINAHNQPMQMSNIITALLENYSLIITEDEFKNIIETQILVFRVEHIGDEDYYSLTDDLYKELELKIQKGVEFYIDIYIHENGIDSSAKEIIYRYLYHLTTTNIASYKRLLGLITGKEIKSDEIISVDPTLFTDTERSIIFGFLSWDNSDKNLIITNIILCCLEYCLVISGDKANELTTAFLKERYLFLDTNIIFRALGINGSQRKIVTLAFLTKCKQAGIQLLITSYTKREFFNTLKHYVNIATKMPAENVYDDAYEDLCDYNVFAYYYDWRSKHRALPSNLFWAYLDSEVETLINLYSIVEDKSNIFSPEAQKKINEYDAGICKIKENDPSYIRYYYGVNKHDAVLVFIAEKKRMEVKKQNTKADCLIATTDKQLRFWDYSRSASREPFIVYPSQLFALLIKLTGRSTDDIKSFIGFINIKPTLKQISETKANAILSAIGSLTDDFKTQKLLVSSVLSDDFQKIILSTRDENELYEMSKTYGKKLIDDRIKEQENQIATAEQKLSELRMTIEQEEHSRNAERQEFEKEKSLVYNQVRKKDKMIEDMAFRHTKPQYLLCWFFLPFFAILLGISIAILIAIGIWGNNDNNLAIRIIDWFCETPIGKKMEDPYGWIIPATLGIVCSLETYGFIRIFSSSKRRKKREEYMKNYIKKLKTKNN